MLERKQEKKETKIKLKKIYQCLTRRYTKVHKELEIIVR
jgi:hypothetical protein